MTPHCGLNLHSSNGREHRTSFSCACLPLGEGSIQLFCLFLNWGVCFLSTRFLKLFLCLHSSTQTEKTKTFSPVFPTETYDSFKSIEIGVCSSWRVKSVCEVHLQTRTSSLVSLDR